MFNIKKIQFHLHFAIEPRYIEPRKTKGTVQDVLDDLGLEVVELFSHRSPYEVGMPSWPDF
jgi:hypothetical protein